MARTISRRLRPNWRTLLATISSAVCARAAADLPGRANRGVLSAVAEFADLPGSGVSAEGLLAELLRCRGDRSARRTTSRQPPTRMGCQRVRPEVGGLVESGAFRLFIDGL